MEACLTAVASTSRRGIANFIVRTDCRPAKRADKLRVWNTKTVHGYDLRRRYKGVQFQGNLCNLKGMRTRARDSLSGHT